MAIKMIGLDLDGTTLNTEGKFSNRTIEAFRKAKNQGVHIVVATGRALCSLPPDIYSIDGLEYVITSNGARIIETSDNKTIYENFINVDVVKIIHDFLKSKDAMIEIFYGGRAYISAEEFERITSGGFTRRNRDYVSSTRMPVEDIFGMLYEKADSIENISINYSSYEEKSRMEEELRGFSGMTLTSSFPFNNEIGGLTTSKATALLYMMEKLNVKKEELMCCGDSPNDLAMLQLAGVGVAMDNGEEVVKSHADYITASNGEDGVAKAIERFVLK